MSYRREDLETRTFLSLGKWNWTVSERAGGLILDRGTTHGREGEAHLRAVHAAAMIAAGEAPQPETKT